MTFFPSLGSDSNRLPATATQALIEKGVGGFSEGVPDNLLRYRYANFRDCVRIGLERCLCGKWLVNPSISMERGGYVYIMSNRHRTAYYVGVTSNLLRRTHEHRTGNDAKFTKKYNCTDLLYYRAFGRIEEALVFERQLKRWRRTWKDELIKTINPTMKDLFPEIDAA